tara:strand:- start:18964 stop:19605 length:642 start_codon:yes stop_codon:yes gene_type:complete
MKKVTTVMSLAFLALTQVNSASASSLPGAGIDNITTYLDSAYFNGYVELNNFDFSNVWKYTAIAYESGNQNTVSINSGPGWNPADASFTTANDSNFGQWSNVNFSTEQLYFEDDNPTDIGLDPFTIANSSFFRVFQLTSDSNSLSYLGGNALTLALGTIIVGFNDNGLGLGDGDFDDIIVALQPVPIPAAAFLFAPALIGFMGLRRRAKNTVA